MPHCTVLGIKEKPDIPEAQFSPRRCWQTSKAIGLVLELLAKFFGENLPSSIQDASGPLLAILDHADGTVQCSRSGAVALGSPGPYLRVLVGESGGSGG